MLKRKWSMLPAIAIALGALAFQPSGWAQETTTPSLTNLPKIQPVERRDPNSQLVHQQLLEKKTKGKIDIYFEGDSIARRWDGNDYPLYQANFKKNFFGWNAADFAWGADAVENILWRLENGELDGVHPKIIVLLAGTNNVGTWPPRGDNDPRIMKTTAGIKQILDVFKEKAPDATVILMAIFPRGDNPRVNPIIEQINKNIKTFADGKKVRFLDINDKLTDDKGNLKLDLFMGGHLHPNEKGYQIWADALKPIFTEILGPPAKEDHAPPSTGDPSAKHPLQPTPTPEADASK